jgi:hypothetical protein
LPSSGGCIVGGCLRCCIDITHHRESGSLWPYMQASSLGFIIWYCLQPEVLKNWFLPVCLRVGWPDNSCDFSLRRMLGLIVLTEPPGLTSNAGTRPSSPNGVPGVGTELSLSREVSGAGTRISSSSQMEGLNKSYANMAGEGGSRLDLS